MQASYELEWRLLRESEWHSTASSRELDSRHLTKHGLLPAQAYAFRARAKLHGGAVTPFSSCNAMTAPEGQHHGLESAEPRHVRID